MSEFKPPKRPLSIEDLQRGLRGGDVQAQIPWIKARVQCPRCGEMHEVYVRLESFSIAVRYPGQPLKARQGGG